MPNNQPPLTNTETVEKTANEMQNNNANQDKPSNQFDNQSDNQPNNRLRVAVAQAQFLVGDLKLNADKMKTLATNAKKQGADIIIFPELALLGYPPEDLLLRPNLASRVKTAMESLSKVQDIVMIVGYPHIDHNGTFNSVAILHNGQKKGFYHKQNLSNYGVFDERRYFDKGRNQVLFDYKGVTIGLLVGDDISQGNCVESLKEKGGQLAIVLNASPFEIGKQEQRKEVLCKRAQNNALPIIYANAVGGQDDLVFDGGSMVVQADGAIAHEASRFLPQMMMANYQVDTHTFDSQNKAPLALSEESEIYQALVVGLRDYVNNSGFNEVIIGLSGGIDSALTLCIAVDALGADKVYAVMMPYKYTSQISLEDSQAQTRRLNVSYTVCPIFDAVDGMNATLAPLFKDSPEGQGKAEENIQARARGMVLMALSNKFGHLLVTTGNKSELAIGYSTLYGDMAGGFDVLKDVYKSQIYKLAHYRNRIEDTPVIPERVISRPASSELRPNQQDTDRLPEYESLDAVLSMYIDADMSYQEIVDKGFDGKMVGTIIRMVDSSEYKRHQSAVGTKISQKAFGRERRYPMVNNWSVQE